MINEQTKAYIPSAQLAEGAHADKAKYEAMYAVSIDDPDNFWAEHGKCVDWIKPFTKVKNTSFAPGNVCIKWFEDGTLNVSANCIDRHVETRGDQTAIIWEPDSPTDSAKHITYKELHHNVCKFANSLKELGVEKGDRVVVYMNAFGSRYSTQALKLSIEPFYAPNREKLVADSVSQKMLDALKTMLRLEWMELDKPEDFRAMCALPTEDKQNLFAWATGLALKAQLSSDNTPSTIIEELGARMDVDVAACWRPTAANYWGTVTKAHIASVAKDVISDSFADERGHEKKGEAAAAMDLAFAENAKDAAGLDKAVAAKTTRWLPKGMAFAEVNFADELIDDQTPDIVSADEDGGETLPAFLKDDVA